MFFIDTSISWQQLFSHTKYHGKRASAEFVRFTPILLFWMASRYNFARYMINCIASIAKINTGMLKIHSVASGRWRRTIAGYCGALLLGTTTIYGQTATPSPADSIRQHYIDQMALRNPMMRQAGVVYEVQGQASLDTRFTSQGKLSTQSRVSRTTAFLNFPAWRRGQHVVSGGIQARYQTIALHDMIREDGSIALSDHHIQQTILGGNIMYTYLDSLRHKPIIYNITTSTMVNPETGQIRLNVSGIAMLSLIQRPQTTLSVGLLVLTDPTSPLPVLPILQFRHHFTAWKTELFLDITRVAMRKTIGKQHWLWLSNDLMGQSWLIQQSASTYPSRMLYTALELKTNITYEQQLNRKTILSVTGGVTSLVNARLRDTFPGTTIYANNTQTATPYFQIGISFLPFWHLNKR